MLVAGYGGYQHLFATVTERLQKSIPEARLALDFRPSDSASARRAVELAESVFGKDHWTSGFGVDRYYNVERGYWMYWGSFSFPEGHDRHRISFEPFALIWDADEEGGLKVLSGDRALVDFDRPFNLLGGSKPSVVRARIEGYADDVMILDDRGTPGNLEDDLVIQMPYAEYSEADSEIRCKERVLLSDQNVEASGNDLTIKLQPSTTSNGFPTAETVRLERNVVIRAADAGQTGLLPGSARPDQLETEETQRTEDVEPPKTPVVLSCDGVMTLQLGRSRIPTDVGPPAPPRPTIADFSRNVVLERGSSDPDRITGDHLHAVLVPVEKFDTTGDDPSEGGGPSTGGLRLLRARVDGHAVWLESRSENVRVRGNELIYEKPSTDQPDVSYFRADAGSLVEFERVETDDEGQILSVATIWATDATMYGDPQHQGQTTVIARGPGRMEIRTNRGAPISQTASWRNEMIIETLQPGDPTAGENADQQLRIRLTGLPYFEDPEQLMMVAREEIEVSLEPRPTPNQDSSDLETENGAFGGRSYRVNRLAARGDVHLITPEQVDDAAIEPIGAQPSVTARRELNARDWLVVDFTYPVTPALALNLGQQRALTEAQIVQTSYSPPQLNPEDTSPIESNRPVEARADLVWAQVEVVGQSASGNSGFSLSSSTGGQSEIREARLRGEVFIYQDPAEGDEEGFRVEAEAVDLKLPARGQMTVRAQGADQPAIAGSDELWIQGPSLFVDQGLDFASVEGKGFLWQLSEIDPQQQFGLGTARENAPVTSVAGADSGREELAERSVKQQMLIEWSEGMTFHGSMLERNGLIGPARALFVGDVEAKLPNERVSCGRMEAIFDRPLSFDRDRDDSSEETNSDTRPVIDVVICREDVRLRSVVHEEQPNSGNKSQPLIKEYREVIGDSLTYVRSSDNFWMDDPGTIYVTTLQQEAENNNGSGTRRRQRSPGPWSLNQLRVDFNKSLEGKLGAAGSTPHAATFEGDARAIRARVRTWNDHLNFDRTPADAVQLSAERIYADHDPGLPKVGVPAQSSLRAFGDAEARTNNEAIAGDIITYDSTKDLFYIKGSAANPVAFASQEARGQRLSRGLAESARYNAKTGTISSSRPGDVVFFRPKTGSRAGFSPDKPKVERPKEELPSLRLPAQNDLERQGFTGS